MPIRSRRNQYRGVNAHLQSVLQADASWDSFHSNYISDLAEAIDGNLPSGYLVDVERSLQIHEFHPDTGELLIRQRKPDLTIYDTERNRPRRGSDASGSAVATLVLPLSETLPITDESFYSALIIYEQQDDKRFGRPVTRIELLSPTNKSSGHGYFQYVDKRYAALNSGLRLVEIDYLHETPSPINGIPHYPNQEASFPYYITVSDPTPSLEKGLSETYGFAVDEPIPKVDIPLAGTELLPVDFGGVYNRTFRKLQAYSYLVDYEQLPINFERYSEADQERIKRRMETVRLAQEQGANLEEGPFPLPDV
ncbi:MAG: DUF4058 family protein [Anaerolineae bacterium]|nr:DUF4058 family protein [Anaerolineae bacterium]